MAKPKDFVLRGGRGLAQPAVSFGDGSNLRVIYGPDYTAAENLN